MILMKINLLLETGMGYGLGLNGIGECLLLHYQAIGTLSTKHGERWTSPMTPDKSCGHEKQKQRGDVSEPLNTMMEPIDEAVSASKTLPERRKSSPAVQHSGNV